MGEFEVTGPINTGVNRGRVTTAYTVWCGDCSQWDEVQGVRSDAEKDWKRRGWTNTRTKGRRCPDCTREL